MPLSAKTKNLLDLFGDIVAGSSLERHDDDVLDVAISYGIKSGNWAIAATVATERARRAKNTAT